MVAIEPVERLRLARPLAAVDHAVAVLIELLEPLVGPLFLERLLRLLLRPCY